MYYFDGQTPILFPTMNGKTCLLCGRSLGRIRPGSGGDFCSREHRNQYRLRRSMDCLTEANKVSTLARRRENPKPLTNSAVQSAGRTGPEAMLVAPRIGGGAACQPHLNGFGSQLKLEFNLLRAGPVSPAGGAKPPRNGRREAGMRFVTGRASGPALPAGRPAGMPYLKPAQRFRKVRPAPKVGNALRVSARAGFRLRPPRLRARRHPAPERRIAQTRGARILPVAPAALVSGPRMCSVEMAQPAALWSGLLRQRGGLPGSFQPTVLPQAKPGSIPAPAPKACRTTTQVAVLKKAGPTTGVNLPVVRFELDEAALPALCVARLQAVRQTPASGRAGGRMAFIGMAFSGSPDAPAQYDWAGDSGQENGR